MNSQRRERTEMKKLLKNKKALSPVVAAIILIAVTVAVSIAVAAWMGSLTIGFMETAEITITNVDFTGGVDGTIDLDLTNSGTSDATITAVKVNGATQSTTSPSLPLTITAGDNTETLSITMVFNAGSKYSISLFANDGTLLSSYTATATATSTSS